MLGEAAAELGEEGVARLVPEGVVDLVHAVDVEHEDGDDLAGHGDRDRFGKRFKGAAAARQAGERVVEGVVAELVDEPLVLDGDADVRGDGLEELEVAGHEVGQLTAYAVGH